MCAFSYETTTKHKMYTLSLHDALPIYRREIARSGEENARRVGAAAGSDAVVPVLDDRCARHRPRRLILLRSEEHTSELQSRFDLVCRLLLEKINGNC